MDWHEKYPEWSVAVHAIARRLAETAGTDPDEQVTCPVPFTHLDTWLPEAVDLFGVPEEELQGAIELQAAIRKARAARMVRGF
jgi:hypothetical protein